jgi:peptidyl-dipeptidase Dcp
MKKTLISVLSVMALAACNNANPLIDGWDTPYGIPPFAQIEEAHYLPAIEAGIKQQAEEIEAIIANTQEPTFENVIEAFDRSGEILSRTSSVLFNLSESDATDSMQKIVEQALPLITAHSNDIYMNPAFFAKVDALYKKIDELGLNREQQMVLKKIHNSFVKNGVALNEADQAKMREINNELSTLEFNFGNNLLAENNAFAEKFGISISQYTTKMTSSEDRALREQMFKAYSSRGNNNNDKDNKEICKRIMELRIQKANLLGYTNPADYILADKMAGNAATVDNFLAEIMTAAVKKAKEEVADMQKIMNEDIAAGKLPKGSKIEPWDWFYYAERVRVAKYNLTEEETMPYFKMENVRQGVFNLAKKLYGINVEPVEGVEVYHPDVEAFKVTDADGSLIGIFLSDYFPRSTKRGGAWMTNFVEQYKDAKGNNIRPVIVNVGSFNAPTEDRPSLLSLDNTETLFHEFGHALHGLLSQCTYKTVAGTSVSRDFVELPSQIHENWAFLPDMLATYAFHYETGEVIPAELVKKIQETSNFNQGFMTAELCAASILDLKWHQLTSMEGIEVEEFEAKVCREMGLNEQIIPRYRSTYFNHIFNSGYSAGYYSYLWAEVLDKDAFEFIEASEDPAAAAMSFRKNILEMGGSEEPMTLYKKFRGQEPDASALLRGRGL